MAPPPGPLRTSLAISRSLNLNGAVDALEHGKPYVGVSVAESPRPELLLLLVDRLTHEHVRETLAVDELDEVERVTLRRQRVPQRPAAILLLFEHLHHSRPQNVCRPIATRKQERLAVASIARDDPSTLFGDDPFPRTRMHRDRNAR